MHPIKQASNCCSTRNGRPVPIHQQHGMETLDLRRPAYTSCERSLIARLRETLSFGSIPFLVQGIGIKRTFDDLGRISEDGTWFVA